MWWEKAAQLVSSFGYGNKEEYEDDGELMLPVLIRKGTLEYIRVWEGMKVKDILCKLTNKHHYALIQLKRDVFNRILGRRILEDSEKIEELKGVNWDCRSVETADIWLVDLDQEVTVFFNTYFRMSTGCPSHLQRLYIEPGMTVSDFEIEVKRSLAIPLDDFRMGLYGHSRGEVFPLDGDMLMSELREREENLEDPSFFQFQFHPESESQAALGVSRASNLFMRANRGTRKLKKCWFYLQGTSLFYRPSMKDHSWVREIERVDLCKIVYKGANKARDSWRFDIIPEEGKGPIRAFTSPLKHRIIKWVKELRIAHPTQEINEPVTLERLRQEVPHAQIEPCSKPTKTTDEAMTQINSFQRRLIEIAEANLHRIELDGGVLLVNGIEELDEGLARKWVDAVRELLHHCSKMQATRTAQKAVGQIKQVLRKLRDWIQFLESLHLPGQSPMAPPEPETIKEIIEDCTDLVNTFRFYVIKLNSQEDFIEAGAERDELEEMVETLEDALASNIFEAKPTRRHRVIRGAFRPTDEVKEAQRQAKEEAKLKAKVEKEKEKRRKMRSKEGVNSVWSMVEGRQRSYEEDAYEASKPSRRYSYDDLRATEPREKSKGGLSGWLSKVFKRKTIKNTMKIDYDQVEQELEEEDEHYAPSEIEEIESDSNWEEAEAMFKQYSKSRRDKAHTAHPEEKDKVIRSGFNKFGQKKPIIALESPFEEDEDQGEREKVLEPVRTSPEDEELLLKMLKDPRVQGLLKEFKEDRHASAAPIPEPNTNAAASAWGRRRNPY